MTMHLRPDIRRPASKASRSLPAISRQNGATKLNNGDPPRSGRFSRHSSKHPEQGYILLTLMFLATLVIISLAAVAPQLTQQLKRDQEEELIHRGVQYSRAIQHFYKKTGRYPVRLEELDNFNNIRFLRKHYKDPINGQDFKLLHFGEVRMTMAGGGAGIPGAVAAANQPGGLASPANGQSPFNNQAFGNQGFGNPGLNTQGGGGFSNQGLNGSLGGFDKSGSMNQQAQGSNQASSDDASDSNATSTVSPASPGAANQPMSASGMAGGNQVFGGGPIVGVASTSTKKSIREFNKKNHYKDWQFIYDPSSDRGGLLNTPAQPNLNAGANLNQGNSQTGPGQGQGFGAQQPGGFGQQPNGFGQQPSGFGQQGMPMPNQPPDQMQQQEQ
jgi:type II secretory pathway pseudopilin PulG